MDFSTKKFSSRLKGKMLYLKLSQNRKIYKEKMHSDTKSSYLTLYGTF